MNEDPPDGAKQQKKSSDQSTESKKSIELKQELRERNIECLKNKQDEDFYRGLDSNLKKTTGFVKRLKTISEDSKHSLLMFIFFPFIFLLFIFFFIHFLSIFF